MSAYVIFNYTILDRSKINQLAERALQSDINSRYGAEAIVGSPAKAVEGKVLPNMVIYKFSNFQSAKDRYYCDSDFTQQL